MHFATALIALVASLTTITAAPTVLTDAIATIEPRNETSPANKTAIIDEDTYTTSGAIQPMYFDDNQEKWLGSKKKSEKITVYTFNENDGCDPEKWARHRAHLQPWMCKNFGFGNRFGDIMFELPQVVRDEDIYCQLWFYMGDGCTMDNDPAPRMFDNSNAMPECLNQVGDMIPKRSVMPHCWYKNRFVKGGKP